MATLDDYAEAKRLLDPTFDAVVAGDATTWSRQQPAGRALPTPERVGEAWWGRVLKEAPGYSPHEAAGAGPPPPPPPAPPKEAVAPEPLLGPGAEPDETEVPLLQRLHRDLFRRDRKNLMPLDEAVVFLRLQKPELSVDRGFELVDHGDGILWAICEYDEPGRPVLVPLWNL